MAAKAQTELSAEQRREIAGWFEANSAQLPESVRIFMALHHKYLTEDGDPRRAFESAYRELRRALRITPSSESIRPTNHTLIAKARPLDLVGF